MAKKDSVPVDVWLAANKLPIRQEGESDELFTLRCHDYTLGVHQEILRLTLEQIRDLTCAVDILLEKE